jgi:hypothetical protein
MAGCVFTVKIKTVSFVTKSVAKGQPPLEKRGTPRRGGEKLPFG